MPREINSTQEYQDKIVKLIPTEIVGAYMVLAGIIPTEYARAGTSTVSGILLLLTPLYLWRLSKVRNKIQLFVTTMSFVVWVYSLGGPFQAWNLYYPWLGSIILILWSLCIPIFVTPVPQASGSQD